MLGGTFLGHRREGLQRGATQIRFRKGPSGDVGEPQVSLRASLPHAGQQPPDWTASDGLGLWSIGVLLGALLLLCWAFRGKTQRLD